MGQNLEIEDIHKYSLFQKATFLELILVSFTKKRRKNHLQWFTNIFCPKYSILGGIFVQNYIDILL